MGVLTDFIKAFEKDLPLEAVNKDDAKKSKLSSFLRLSNWGSAKKNLCQEIIGCDKLSLIRP